MRLLSSDLFQRFAITNKHAKSKGSDKLTEKSLGLQLPTIWARSNSSSRADSYHWVSKLNISGCETFDFLMANQKEYSHDFLVPLANDLAPFISQAILSIASKKMTLDEIKKWLQQNIANKTKTKDIQYCLEHCSIFSREIEGSIVYWKLEYDRLKLEPFGQNILDTGVAGGIEFWQGQRPMVNM